MIETERLYELNGVLFWTERDIRLRDMMADYFYHEIRYKLLSINPSWKFFQVEAPLLTPKEYINPNYTDDDMWSFKEAILRPETTPGSFVYAQRLMRQGGDKQIKPPLVVWQVGKSFRRESDQPLSNMRLKEFYQQEFQCIFTSDTKMDYMEAMKESVRLMIEDMILKPTRLAPSDRLPNYSLKTSDVEAFIPQNGWREVCSMSLRKDFPSKIKFTTKKGIVEQDILVFEIAIGLDRCVMLRQ